MAPNAAMVTTTPGFRPRDAYMMRMYGRKPVTEPTEFMVHYENRGPRRVHRHRKTGDLFVRLNRRFVKLTEDQIKKLLK